MFDDVDRSDGCATDGDYNLGRCSMQELKPQQQVASWHETVRCALVSQWHANADNVAAVRIHGLKIARPSRVYVYVGVPLRTR